MNMKSLKTQFIGAIAMVLVAAIAMGSSTYAWFTLNNRVTASNMEVRAKTAGSLIIRNTDALPDESTTSTDWRFSDTEHTELLASTHDWTYNDGTTSGATTKGLKYVSNPQNINPETGTQLNETATLNYLNAVNATGKDYYKTYSVFIASADEALEHQDITITLDDVLNASKEINKAISIDFYGAEVTTTGDLTPTSGNYLDTLNVAGVKNNGTATANAAYEEFKIEDITVPKADGTKAYAVTMVVYYDGALVEKAGTYAYTVYKPASGYAPIPAEQPYYYTNNQGTSIASVASGAPVSSYFVADFLADATGTTASGSNSARTYARTTEIANIQDVTLQATFVADPHP